MDPIRGDVEHFARQKQKLHRARSTELTVATDLQKDVVESAQHSTAQHSTLYQTSLLPTIYYSSQVPSDEQRGAGGAAGAGASTHLVAEERIVGYLQHSSGRK